MALLYKQYHSEQNNGLDKIILYYESDGDIFYAVGLSVLGDINRTRYKKTKNTNLASPKNPRVILRAREGQAAHAS